MSPTPASQADEVSALLDALKPLITSFIRASETSPSVHPVTSSSKPSSIGINPSDHSESAGKALVEAYPPKELEKILEKTLDLPEKGLGREGIVPVVEDVLRYSVNTWDQGFLDKLYASTNAIGVVSEMLLGVLNTNVHVYQVSPALTLIEKTVTRRLAQLFGLGPNSGGISQPGGSASNASSIVIARNHLFPETKKTGITTHKFKLFTSAHGHYSLEKAAQMFGFGSDNVIPVPVDEIGQMKPDELDRLVSESKERGENPFYVNATAGTTVLGSFDPLEPISAVCKKHGLWLHVDGSWGGPVIFNEEFAKSRLKGVDLVDSVAVNPHKMLGVPMTCSFLLVRDMRWAWEAMTLPAGYLFHNSPGEEIYDLADLTPQCGRRGDALKMFLSWAYHGTSGFSSMVSTGYSRSQYLLSLLQSSQNIVVSSPIPLPCWQVCFYYAPNKELGEKEVNTKRTRAIAERLVKRGFMTDYAPGPVGEFFRVVLHYNTEEATVRNLVGAIEELGEEVIKEEK